MLLLQDTPDYIDIDDWSLDYVSNYNLFLLCAGFMRLNSVYIKDIANFIIKMFTIPYDHKSIITISNSISTPYSCMLYLSTRKINYGFKTLNDSNKSNWSFALFAPSIKSNMMTNIQIERIGNVGNRFNKKNWHKSTSLGCAWKTSNYSSANFAFECGLIGIPKSNNTFDSFTDLNKNKNNNNNNNSDNTEFKLCNKWNQDFSNVKNASFYNINWTKSNRAFIGTDRKYIKFSKNKYQLCIDNQKGIENTTNSQEDLTIYIDLMIEPLNSNGLHNGLDNEEKGVVSFTLGNVQTGLVRIRNNNNNNNNLLLDFSKYIYYFGLSSNQCWCDCDPWTQFNVKMEQF